LSHHSKSGGHPEHHDTKTATKRKTKMR